MDEARHSAPGYYAVIANPQDLGSIRSRLEGGRHYSSPLQVDRDVRQMVHNAQTYNRWGRRGGGGAAVVGLRWWGWLRWWVGCVVASNGPQPGGLRGGGGG